MIVVEKNCIKKAGKSEQKKNMAKMGSNAYISAKPKTEVSVSRYKASVGYSK